MHDFSVSTHTIAERQRLGFIRETLAAPHLSMDVTPTGPAPFSAAIRMLGFGRLRIATTVVSPTRLTRTEQQAAAMPQREHYLDLMLDGGLTVTQDGRQLEIGQKQCLVSAGTRAFVNDLGATDGKARMMTLCIPEDVMPARYAMGDWGIERYDLLAGASKLLRETAVEAVEEVDYLSASDRESIGTLLIDLVRSMTRLSAPTSIQRRHPIAEAVEDYLEDHYLDESVTLDTAALEIGVSTRSLRRALLASELTFTDMLRRLRAAEMKRRLASARHARETVTEIALSSGFGDVNTAGRVFKTIYGVSPRQSRLIIE